MILKPFDKELELAQKYLDEMAQTGKFSDFEEAWQNFLARISKVRELIAKRLRGQKGFQQWYRQYKHFIEKDPLIVYMHQARNAETHSLEGSIDRPFSLVVEDKIGRPFQIDALDVKFKDGLLTIDIKTPDHFLAYDVKFLPGDVQLKRIKNRGRTYDPPKSHMQNNLENLHPVVAAKMSLSFYRSLVNDARTSLLQ